jgi:hypothetical protein
MELDLPEPEYAHPPAPPPRWPRAPHRWVVLLRQVGTTLLVGLPCGALGLLLACTAPFDATWAVFLAVAGLAVGLMLGVLAC